MKKTALALVLPVLIACGGEAEKPKPKPSDKPKEVPFPLDEKTLLTADDLSALGISSHEHFKGDKWREINKIKNGFQIRGTCNEGDIEIEIVALKDAAAALERCVEQLKQERTRKDISEAKPGRTSNYSLQEERVVGEKGWASSFLRKEGFATSKIAFQTKQFFVKSIWSAPATEAGQIAAIEKKGAELAGRINDKLK